MSRKERIKTILDYLKTMITTFIIGLFGIVSYTFIHIDELEKVKLCAIGFAFILNIAIIGFFVKIVIKKLDELEKEK